MTTLETWIDASLTIMDENLGILRAAQTRNDIDILIQQSKAMKKHVDSFIDFLERKRRNGVPLNKMLIKMKDSIELRFRKMNNR